MKRTERQAAFARAYVETGNASEAYRRAYNARGKKETIHRAALACLHKPQVTEEIERLQAVIEEKAVMTAADVVAELAIIAEYDILDYYIDTPKGPVPCPLCRLTPRQRKAIKRVRYNARGLMEIEFHDRLSALEQLAKHIGFYKEDGVEEKTVPQLVINIGKHDTADGQGS